MSNRRTANITKRPSVYDPTRKMARRRKDGSNDIGFENLCKEIEKTPHRFREQTRSPDQTSSISGNQETETSKDDCSEQEQRSFQSNPRSDEKGTSLLCDYYVCISLLMIIVLCILYKHNLGGNSVPTCSHNTTMWEENIENLKGKFPSQSSITWNSFMSGIKTIVTVKPVKPSVFLLLHNDEKTSTCLAQKVGIEAAKFLGEPQQTPIIIKGEDLKMNNSMMQDYGLFAETHKNDIRERHVMIVLDLHKIPAILAQAFHSLCDGENPVVHEAAYLFTMHINGNDERSPTATAEKTLKTLWENSLNIDIMEPLITRITDTVLSLQSEVNIPC